ncbi:MAG TPA: hypothetical protein PKA13_22380 [Geminicoccaceae bacterium]|nr:hypothetical protein [Geminicoccus sp.]HMU52541.1 hypothetical protein [Geminicoccaceae bacterium]
MTAAGFVGRRRPVLTGISPLRARCLAFLAYDHPEPALGIAVWMEKSDRTG